jgi:hypothetical protein
MSHREKNGRERAPQKAIKNMQSGAPASVSIVNVILQFLTQGRPHRETPLGMLCSSPSHRGRGHMGAFWTSSKSVEIHCDRFAPSLPSTSRRWAADAAACREGHSGRLPPGETAPGQGQERVLCVKVRLVVPTMRLGKGDRISGEETRRLNAPCRKMGACQI